ncbi:MAG: Flp pilus assembly protein CpaB [Candidatus Acidiferrales bacterium]
MNRNRLFIGLAAAAVLALVLSIFVYREFKRIASVSASDSMRTIVVAAEPLDLGTRLDASMLRTIPWPSDAPVTGMFTKIQDCVNHALITPVAENEPILARKLASTDSGAGLPATIPPGMRGLSVAVNNVIGVAGFVTPGTKVDVLVTGAIIAANGSAGPTITRTILENVRVLAAGQKIQQDRDGKPEIVPVITLLVSPEHAAILAMASSEGKIQLALRNTVDTRLVNPAPVSQVSLFAGANSPAPSKPSRRPLRVTPPPPAPYTVEVINGTTREMKSFPND